MRPSVLELSCMNAILNLILKDLQGAAMVHMILSFRGLNNALQLQATIVLDKLRDELDMCACDGILASRRHDLPDRYFVG